MKKTAIIIFSLLSAYCAFAQQNDWSSVENVFGKKGIVQDNVFKISYPRSDLKVKVGDLTVAPGFALGSWIGFINTGKRMNMQDHEADMKNQAMMMGDLVLLDTEVPTILKRLVGVNLKITAIHNHLINPSC